MSPPLSVILSKKKKVIEAATRMFFELGYDQMTVDALTAEVGGSKAYIYKNFGGKQRLFEAVVKAACEDILIPLTDVDLTHSELEEGLLLIAERFLKLSLSEKSIALHRLVVAERLRFPHLGDLFLSSGPEQSYKRVAAYLAQQQKLGKIGEGDTHEMAVQFLGLVNAGFHQRMLIAARPTPARKILRQRAGAAVRIFLEGVRR